MPPPSNRTVEPLKFSGSSRPSIHNLCLIAGENGLRDPFDRRVFEARYNAPMTGDIGKKYLLEYSEKLAPVLDSFLDEKIDEALKISKIPAELLKRFKEISSRGKRLRGGLVALGYNIAGGQNPNVELGGGLIMELFHAALLVHDDIMDRDSLRRGVRTIHKQFEDIGKSIRVRGDPAHYGESMAGCLFDAIFYMTWEKLLSLPCTPEHIFDAGKIYTKYALRTAWGQSLDVTTTSLESLNEDDILKVISIKSGEYTTTLPFLFGAALGGLKDKKVRAVMESYSLALGWTFHIQDDLLGMFGNDEETGKPSDGDLKEGKNTLLMLHLHQHGTDEQRVFQKQVLGNSDITKNDVEKMREVLKSAGSYQYVVDLGWKYVEKGKNVIPQITENSKLKTILESLITYMMERVK